MKLAFIMVVMMVAIIVLFLKAVYKTLAFHLLLVKTTFVSLVILVLVEIFRANCIHKIHYGMVKDVVYLKEVIVHLLVYHGLIRSSILLLVITLS